MFGSEILDIVIGLAFVYVLFSLLCTTLTEGIARIVALRSHTLEVAIRNMIEGANKGGEGTEDGPAAIHGTTLDVKTLYASPLVRSLARAGRLDRARVFFASAENKWKAARPSYIPSRAFTMALYDTLLTAKPTAEDPPPPSQGTAVPADEVDQRVESEVQAHLQKSTEEQIEGVRQFIRDSVPPGLPVRDQMLALLANEGGSSLALQTKAQKAFHDLREAVNQIEPPESNLKRGLNRILDTAEEEAKDFDEALAKTRLGIESWFDDSMDRVTGWYARNTRTIVVAFAIIVTFIFNVDTLAIANALHSEPVIRDAIVSQAELFTAQNQSEADDAEMAVLRTSNGMTVTVNSLQSEIDRLGVPIGWVVVLGEEQPAPPPIKDPARRVLAQIAQLLGTGVAVATSPAIIQYDRLLDDHVAEIEKAERYRQEWPRSPEDWGRKLAGLFITVVALSLGAPFWFDALNKLVNLRAAGKPPARADAVDESISVRAGRAG